MIAKRNRKLTSTQNKMNSTTATGILLSRYTMSDRIHKKRLHARKPKICILLTPIAVNTHLKYYRHHWSTCTGAKCSLLMNRDFVWSVITDILPYGGKETCNKKGIVKHCERH